MQKYIGYFSLDYPNIKVVKWPEYDVQELLKSSNFLITDYSSIAMDFAYMKKPLLYFQFDYEMYRKGHYPEGYFQYERDGFGKVCRDLDILFLEMGQVLEQDFEMEKMYQERVLQFYDYFDRKNCKRNYEAIKKI